MNAPQSICGTRADQALFEDLDDFLRDDRFGLFTGERRERPLMEIILGCEPAHYRRATREVQAMADWLKRFAEAELETEEV